MKFRKSAETITPKMTVALEQEVAAPGIQFLQAVIGEGNMQFLMAIQYEKRFNTVQETISWILSLVPSSNNMTNQPHEEFDDPDKHSERISEQRDEMPNPQPQDFHDKEIAGIICSQNTIKVKNEYEVQALTDKVTVEGHVVPETLGSTQEHPPELQQPRPVQSSVNFSTSENSIKRRRPKHPEARLSMPIISETSILPESNALLQERMSTTISEPSHSASSSMDHVLERNDVPEHASQWRSKMFKCKFCDATFLHRSGLALHTQIHTGEEMYNGSAVVPGKKRKKNIEFAEPEKGPLKEGGFSCKVCHKTFNTKSYLGIHEILHTGERPFSCELCGKSFRAKSNLLGHKSVVHFGKKRTKVKINTTISPFFSQPGPTF